MNQPVGNEIFNVPNQISMVRLGLSVLLFVAMPFQWYWAALVLFLVAAGTDWVDGWWARKYNQVTQLGRILDPFCDKILICGAFILLAVAMGTQDRLPWYATVTGPMAVIVVGREMLVTALRGFIEQSGGDFSAKMAGKLKMVFQCVAVAAGLIALAILKEPDATVPNWLLYVLIFFVWLSVLSTIQSGIGYIVAASKMLAHPTKS
ncbi:MAG: CDP-diacylglycerol--glycerol-3-phosphate 3-phosphatidyltransferase [Pirellulaceae bacterium]